MFQSKVSIITSWEWRTFPGFYTREESEDSTIKTLHQKEGEIDQQSLSYLHTHTVSNVILAQLLVLCQYRDVAAGTAGSFALFFFFTAIFLHYRKSLTHFWFHSWR